MIGDGVFDLHRTSKVRLQACIFRLAVGSARIWALAAERSKCIVAGDFRYMGMQGSPVGPKGIS